MSHLLEVSQLRVHFPLREDPNSLVRAVDGVSFAVDAGEVLSLVGESGCGKTTTGRAILRLIRPTAGEVVFEGSDLLRLSPSEMRHYRSKLQIVFQDPYASLNPRMSVGDVLIEAMQIHGIGSRTDRPSLARELLALVGLNASHFSRFPHEFSGGQRQRIGIARALAVRPRLIVCDEPVSALDVSVQAQVINLLRDLQAELGLSYLFIAHDLGVVKHISQRVAVMYLGQIVELAGVERLFTDPKHPYTQLLLSAIPVPDPERAQSFTAVSGEMPSPLRPPTGCRFHPRCPLAVEQCRRELPELRMYEPGHSVACHQAGARNNEWERSALA